MQWFLNRFINFSVKLLIKRINHRMPKGKRKKKSKPAQQNSTHAEKNGNQNTN